VGKLTSNQVKYVHNLIKGMNQRDAYRDAYPKYKAISVIDANASECLRKPAVKAEYERLRKKAAERAIATREKNLRELSYIAYSNVSDLFDGDKLIPISELPEKVRKSIASIKFKKRPCEKDGNTETEIFCQVKFWNKNTALDMINKHLGLYERDNRQNRPTKAMIPDEERGKFNKWFAKQIRGDTKE